MIFPRPEYPNPIFRRNEWLNLNGSGSFLRCSEGRRKFVPFCPESVLRYRICGLYTKRNIQNLSSRKLERKRVNLHFGAVDYYAEVYLSGKFTDHRGYTFEFDIWNILFPKTKLPLRTDDLFPGNSLPASSQRN